MLACCYQPGIVEAGCDEAGRGCLAGAVYAAAVILPEDYQNPILNDSKQLSVRQRDFLRAEIEKNALSWGVGVVHPEEIDQINILNASFLAMHRAITKLSIKPQLLLIDGNRFKPFEGIPHQCIIKGDGLYASIAAASILAKTHRDDYMKSIHSEFPLYAWDANKGYPTAAHRKAILKYGLTPYHRKTFCLDKQLKILF